MGGRDLLLHFTQAFCSSGVEKFFQGWRFVYVFDGTHSGRGEVNVDFCQVRLPPRNKEKW